MRRSVAVLLAAMLFGCSAPAPLSHLPHFEGTSTLDAASQKRAYATAFAYAQSNGCSEIDQIVASTVSSPMGQPMSLIVTERWVLHGCDRTYPFLVNISGDGKGGSIVDVQSDL